MFGLKAKKPKKKIFNNESDAILAKIQQATGQRDSESAVADEHSGQSSYVGQQQQQHAGYRPPSTGVANISPPAMESLNRSSRPQMHHHHEEAEGEDDEEQLPIDEMRVSSLGEHFFELGFDAGLFTDIKLRILDKTYSLHRIVLARTGFFRDFLAENNLAASSSATIDVPDIYVEHMTQESVDIVLANIYGLSSPVRLFNKDEEGNLIPLCITPINLLPVLTTALYFHHGKLVETCMELILSYELSPHQHRFDALRKFTGIKQIVCPTPPEMIMKYIHFTDSFSYPGITEKIEDALLNYLCLEGYHHLEALFVQLPMQWLERVLEADAFWCPTEFSRYQFTKSVVSQRRDDESKSAGVEDEYSEIFKHAIIYTHMTFEQLNEVRADRLVTDEILMKSLWYQTRLRSTVESISEDVVSLSSVLDGNDEKKKDTTKSALATPIRIGVEFHAYCELMAEERSYAGTFFYAGNWWSVFLQRFIDETDSEDDTPKPHKWGIFLRRSEGSQISKIAQSSTSAGGMGVFDTVDAKNGDAYVPDIVLDPITGTTIEKSVSYYSDKRTKVKASFKIFNPTVKCYDPIFESKPNEFTETQSWGFRSRDSVVSPLDVKASANPDATVRLTLVVKCL